MPFPAHRNIVVVAITAMLVLNSPSFGEQDSPCPVLDKYTEVCDAQLNAARRQLDLQIWRLEKIQSLHRRGFASWLEVRRQELKVKTSELKITSFSEFTDFLNNVQDRIAEQEVSYNENQLKAVRVFMPGSSRIIGWLEGFELQGYSVAADLNDAILEYELSKKRRSQARESLSFASDDESWQSKCRLNLELADAQLRARKSTVEYLKSLDEQIGYAKANSRSRIIDQTLSPGDDHEFQRLVLNVAKAEATSTSQLELVRRHLEREQERLHVLERLAMHGHATRNEIGQLRKHLAALKAARDQFLLNQDNLKKTIDGIESNGIDENAIANAGVGYLKVSDWPVDVLANSSCVQYLVEQRRAYYAQMFKRVAAKAKQVMAQEVVGRLKNATSQFASRGNDEDRFGKLITLGQQKEIDSYHWTIDSLDRLISAGDEKMKVLVLEEHRFLRQAVLMGEQPEEPAHDTTTMVPVTNPELLVSVMTTSTNVGKQPADNQIRFGYVESNILDSVGWTAELLIVQQPGYPLGLFELHDELLRPVKLTGYSRSLNFSRRQPLRIQIGSFSSVANGSADNHAAPSLYNSPFATEQYRRNQTRHSRFLENAYPFGILRSDLRRFANFGQPPWYLPGSPNNLRFDQLRSDFKRSPNGRSGTELLNSNNYYDLARPLGK